MAQEETYKIKTICKNCGYTPTEPNLSTEGAGRPCVVFTKIPKGKCVGGFLYNKKCENCGCLGYLQRLE